MLFRRKDTKSQRRAKEDFQSAFGRVSFVCRLWRFSFVVLLASCSRGIGISIDDDPPAESAGVAQIVMDDEHNVMAASESDVENYQIRPCQTAELDRSSYSFTVPSITDAEAPNAVHFLRTQSDEVYRAEWSKSGVTKLNQASLKTLSGDDEFSGFHSGQSFVIAVGVDNYPPTTGGKVVFKPFWVATIEVTK